MFRRVPIGRIVCQSGKGEQACDLASVSDKESAVRAFRPHFSLEHSGEVVNWITGTKDKLAPLVFIDGHYGGEPVQSFRRKIGKRRHRTEFFHINRWSRRGRIYCAFHASFGRSRFWPSTDALAEWRPSLRPHRRLRA